VVQYRRIIINNYTEEEHESDIFDATRDILWNCDVLGVVEQDSCGSANLFCVAKFDEHEVEVDVYDYRGAPKYTD
jgi:hypothetical protein